VQDAEPLAEAHGSAERIKQRLKAEVLPFLKASLSGDFARCEGVGNESEGWREGCDTCLRRTSPRTERVSMIAPPPIIAFECEYLIEPNTKGQQ
jgi:hypothetical protein